MSTLTGFRFSVILPAGLPLLNANKRDHYHRRSGATRQLRSAAALALWSLPSYRAALIAAQPGPVLRRVHILGVLHPPGRGRRDPANWYPSFKAAVDGFVDAGLVADDDHRHVVGPDMRLGSVVQGGQLALHIRELGEDEERWDGVAT
jgi:crossover junction endodeoxyribonuclease RusA